MNELHAAIGEGDNEEVFMRRPFQGINPRGTLGWEHLLQVVAEHMMVGVQDEGELVRISPGFAQQPWILPHFSLNRKSWKAKVYWFFAWIFLPGDKLLRRWIRQKVGPRLQKRNGCRSWRSPRQCRNLCRSETSSCRWPPSWPQKSQPLLNLKRFFIFRFFTVLLFWFFEFFPANVYFCAALPDDLARNRKNAKTEKQSAESINTKYKLSICRQSWQIDDEFLIWRESGILAGSIFLMFCWWRQLLHLNKAMGMKLTLESFERGRC